MNRSYLRYFIKRKGKFHLHSPFVYSFYMEVLNRLPHDYEEELKIRIDKFASTHSNLFSDNDNIFIINGIHKDKKADKIWNDIVKNPDYRLTMDCYRFGIVFTMNRIVKQHFILKW